MNTGTVVAAFAPRPEGHAALQRAVDEARLRGLRLVVVNALGGPAELIVIGMRRRCAVGKLLLGSAAQWILIDAAYPVPAVKA